MALLLRVGSIVLSPRRIVAIIVASICLVGVVEAPAVRADVVVMAHQVYDKDSPSSPATAT